MTGVGWYSQQISLNFLNLVKFYICKPKSTGRGSLIKKQTIHVFLQICKINFVNLGNFVTVGDNFISFFASQIAIKDELSRNSANIVRSFKFIFKIGVEERVY
jgi:hypothetical protein